MLVQKQSTTGKFQSLANAIIADADQPQQLLTKLTNCPQSQPQEADGRCPDHLLSDLFGGECSIAAEAETAIHAWLPATCCEEVDNRPSADATAALDEIRQHAESRLIGKLPGRFVTFGPFQILPAVGSEVPIGRDFQPVPYESISRLHGYIGLDEYSFYVREVPDIPHLGLRPSRYGIWIRQPDEDDFHRLLPGHAMRITADTDVRIGGNGVDAQTGVPLKVNL